MYVWMMIECRKLFGHYVGLRDQRLRICDAYERQLLGVLKQVDWTEEFLNHLKKSLNSTDFLYYKHRHDLMVSSPDKYKKYRNIEI